MGLAEGDHALPVMFPSYSDARVRSSRARFASVSLFDDYNLTRISKKTLDIVSDGRDGSGEAGNKCREDDTV
jgi:hypothetical protein